MGEKKFYCVDYLKKFFQQKDQFSDKVAIVDKGGKEKSTYAEFVRLTNSIAHYLSEKGLKKGDVVVLEMDKTVLHYAARFACFFLGYVYFSLDPDTPEVRKKFMFEQVNPGYIFRQEDFSKIKIDNFLCLIDENISDDEPAYIVYTSGSTGEPKGILHDRSIWENFYYYWKEYVKYCFDNNDIANTKMASTSDMTFILSISDCYFLTCGATLFVIDKNMCLNPLTFKKYIQDNAINAIVCIPYLLNCIISGSSIKFAIVGGENSVYDFLNYDANILNLYGSSECPMIAFGDARLGNTLDFVLSKAKVDINNEDSNKINYTGPGIMIKYICDDKLTKETIDENGKNEYKTLHSLDIAMPVKDKGFKVVGRFDSTVKVFGKRVNLNEIEFTMLEIDNVLESAVVFFDEVDKQYMCGYYVSKDGNPIEHNYIVDFLKDKLPEYMIPKYFQQVKVLARTSRGKVDRSKLPEPNIDIARSEYIAPITKIEKKFCKIVSKVMGIKKVGLNDDFFALGGGSLDIMAITSKLKLSDFKSEYFYEGRIIKDIIRLYVDSIKKPMSDWDKELEGRKNLYKLTGNSYNIYELAKEYGDFGMTHFPIVLKLNRIFSLKRLCKVINKYTDSSSTFKTIVIEKDGVAYYKYAPELYKPFKVEKMTNDEFNEFIKSLKPATSPNVLLYKLKIIKTNSSSYLFFDIHHIIADAFGVYHIIEDIFKMYFGRPMAKNYFYAWLYDYNSKKQLETNEKVIKIQKQKYEAYDWAQNIGDISDGYGNSLMIHDNYINLKDFNRYLKKKKIPRDVILASALILSQAKILKKKRFLFFTAWSNRIGIDNHAGNRTSLYYMFIHFENCETTNDFIDIVYNEYQESIKNINTDNPYGNLIWAGSYTYFLNDINDVLDQPSFLNFFIKYIDIRDSYEDKNNPASRYPIGCYFINEKNKLKALVSTDCKCISKEREKQVINLTFEALQRIINDDQSLFKDFINFW